MLRDKHFIFQPRFIKVLLAEHSNLTTALTLFAMFCASTASAQPVVTFEYESHIGDQRDFYAQTFPPNQVPPTGFNAPTGADWLNASELVIADRSNLKLQKCDDTGNCIFMGADAVFGTRNSRFTFDLPHGIEVTTGETFVVADEDNHAIQLCSVASCTYIGDEDSQANPPGTSLGKWSSPKDAAFDSEGNIHALDTGNNRIQVLRAGDLFVQDVYLTSGSAVGQINNASGIAIDSEDRVIIADTGNHRIQICDTTPTCTSFGMQGTAVGQFNSPVGVDVDDLGRIWIADTLNNRIQVCDYDGACVAFGEFGTGQGQFDEPHDVAVHPSGRVVVVDTRNHRLQLFTTESSFQMNAGLNDAWFYPVTDGQGFFITVFPDLGLVSLAWFTYDTELVVGDANLGDVGHRWLTALGSIDGNRSVMAIDIASGGLFDTTTEITHTPDGSIILTFTGCNAGTVEYDIPSIDQQGTVPIQRIASDNIGLCLELLSE